MPKITTNSAPQKKSYTFVRVGENLYRIKETGDTTPSLKETASKSAVVVMALGFRLFETVIPNILAISLKCRRAYFEVLFLMVMVAI